jgi:hypothetical protein
MVRTVEANVVANVNLDTPAEDFFVLHTYVYLYMREGKEGCCHFRNPGLKRTLERTWKVKPLPFTKTVTQHLRSVVPNVQRHMAYFAVQTRF